LGIVNGCVDDLVQGPFYATMMVNNTYGIKLIPSLQANLVNGSFYQHGGCQDLINQCRTAVAVSDPDNEGDVATVNDICKSAQLTCNDELINPYGDTGRNYYDIAYQSPASFASDFYIGYLNTAS